MKRSIVSLIIFAGMFGAGAVRNAQAQYCSNAILQGDYGFHAFATIVSPGSPGTPRAIIGVFTMYPRGTWTANLILDDNGTIVRLPTQGGTYIVNPDCTGTLFPPASGGSGSVQIVVVDGGNEFYQMRTDPASIILFGTSKKIFPNK